ncbi:MAG TPA: FmdB family zinc ribbon protein [Thermoanaerobaculia bacterium]|nr:FmdB family zinc ribbon protein [Thermoanaerobaculia bacterium]
MPLYEYECRSCGKRTEHIQKFSDPLLTSCPHCSGELRKLFSSPAIQFKGSGFYITDYAKGGAKPESGSEAKTGEKSGAGTPESTPTGEGKKSEPAAAASKSETAG